MELIKFSIKSLLHSEYRLKAYLPIITLMPLLFLFLVFFEGVGGNINRVKVRGSVSLGGGV